MQKGQEGFNFDQAHQMKKIVLYQDKKTSLRILLGAILLISASMGGCDTEQPKITAEAVPLTREAVSAEDGMILLDHPGPKGQLLLGDGTTEYYCDIPGMFRALRQPRAANPIQQAFAQPFDDREWGSFKEGWANAEKLLYVVGSNRMGAMGPTFVPFQHEKTAQEFAQSHGGRVMNPEEITEDFLEAHSREVRDKMRKQGAGAMSGQMKTDKMMQGHSMAAEKMEDENSGDSKGMQKGNETKMPMKH